MRRHEITLPFTEAQVRELQAGDTVFLSGCIFTARDRAHALLAQKIRASEPLPLDLKDTVIYYCGPCPAPPGRVIGSCGPTSATRMDAFAPLMFDMGVRAVIAKGPFAPEVGDSIVKNKAVYLCATGGAGALYAKCVQRVEEWAFPELGTESVKKLWVKNMPLIVAMDCHGASLFKEQIS